MGGPNVNTGSNQPQIPNLHQSFKNPNWPPNFINPENVLDYFCNSGNGFYDISSCNQHLKMQNLNRPLNECLQSMQGIQYTVVGAAPPLYVILKQRRNSPNNVTPLCYYYIINGTVFQAPDLYTFVQSKLCGTGESLHKALDLSRQYARFNVSRGYYWEFQQQSESSKKEESRDDSENPFHSRSTVYQRTRTELLLQELFRKFPPPEGSNVKFGKSDTIGEVNQMEIDNRAEQNEAKVGTEAIKQQTSTPTNVPSSTSNN